MALRRSLLRLATASSRPFLDRPLSASRPFSLSQPRGFSSGESSKPKEEPVKVPIVLHGVAGKYAASLYVTAVRANALEPIYGELTQVLKAAESSPTFSGFLNDMSVSNKDKVKAVQGLFGELGFSHISINFLALLAENGRLHGFKEIMSSLAELMLAYRKQVKATVTSVIELKPKELEDLKKSLRRFVEPDQTILLDQKVDKRIMGGLMVDIGDKHIDLSIASKLKDMERILREPLPPLA